MTLTEITVSPHVLAQELEDDIMLLDLTSEQYYRFSGPASDMWRLLAKFGSVGKTVEHMQASYNVDGAELRQDVEKFVGELEQLKLVQIMSTGQD